MKMFHSKVGSPGSTTTQNDYPEQLMTSTSLPLLDRRTFFGLAAGATAATSLAPSLLAAPAVAKPPPHPPAGLFATRIGNYKVTALLDGIIPLQKGYFAGDEKAIDAVLATIGRADGSLPAPISAFLFQSEEKTILVDAGMGAITSLGPGYGQMSAALHSAGVTPQQIDTLIITHAHPDHLGGVLSAEGTPVFPNAELIIAETEVKFWGSAENLTAAPDDAKGMFAYAQNAFKAYGDQVTQVTSGKEVAKGITLQLAPGHTPGHSILHIDNGDQHVMMVADLFHSAELHTALPDLGFGFDIDQKQAADTRKRLFEQIAADKTVIIGSHAHFPGFGRVLRSNGAYRYIPVSM